MPLHKKNIRFPHSPPLPSCTAHIRLVQHNRCPVVWAHYTAYYLYMMY